MCNVCCTAQLLALSHQKLLLLTHGLQAPMGRAGAWGLLPCTASLSRPCQSPGQLPVATECAQELTTAAGRLGAESLNHLSLGRAHKQRRNRASVAQRAAHRTRRTWTSGIAEAAQGEHPGRLPGAEAGAMENLQWEGNNTASGILKHS